MTDETTGAAERYVDPSRTAPRSTNYPRTDKRSLTKEIDDLDPVMKRLEQAADRARAISDKISGSKPRATGANELKEPAPTPVAPLVTRVRHWREHASKTVEHLEAELQAIEESL